MTDCYVQLLTRQTDCAQGPLAAHCCTSQHRHPKHRQRRYKLTPVCQSIFTCLFSRCLCIVVTCSRPSVNHEYTFLHASFCIQVPVVPTAHCRFIGTGVHALRIHSSCSFTLAVNSPRCKTSHLWIVHCSCALKRPHSYCALCCC